MPIQFHSPHNVWHGNSPPSFWSCNLWSPDRWYVLVLQLMQYSVPVKPADGTGVYLLNLVDGGGTTLR